MWQYILQTLTLSLPNLTLNGFDPSPNLLRPDPVEESAKEQDDSNYESYDPRLADKLRSLYAEFEAQSTRVAELRREAPGAASRRYMERLEEELKLEKSLEQHREASKEKMSLEPIDLGTIERVPNMTSMWERGTQALVVLEKVPGVIAKLERAGQAVEVVETM